MKKFLAALLGSSLVFGLAGCKIEILDKDEDNTEDKDEGVTPNPNPNPDSGEGNGDVDVETPQFETLQDALDYLNGDIGNCEMLMITDRSEVADMDLDGTPETILIASVTSNGSMDGNKVFQHDVTTEYSLDPEVEDSVTEEYTFRVTNEDGSETVYVSVDNENWSIEESDTEPEGGPNFTFDDLQVEDFEHQYGKYTLKDSVAAEIGMNLVIMLTEGELVVEISTSFEIPFGEGVSMVIEINAKLSDFETVSLTIPTVSE